ncbi:sensor histidine kinase [Ammonifex thiophilus]|uniref:histidine kinase n=1 Tax=Ammonifex thiophilus TaxID=444093 RepID=A0A3D8P5S2_9THEO|nr:sensor histidine kinase [Ammonifex thiophilus]
MKPGILALILAERLSLIATAAFLLSRMPALGRILSRQPSPRDKLLLTLVMGGLGILGTYAAVPIHGALANSRVVGVMVAGLLGGPLVGAGAGLIAGVHRYFLGGFTAFACGLAAVVEGTLGGLVRHYYRRNLVPWHIAWLTGLAGEMLQMGIILLTARPFPEALALVKIIGLPMITVNSIGVAIFMLIVKAAVEQEERVAALQAQQALKIANQTLPYLRQGLSEHSAQQVASIIYHSLKVAAVAITDREKILAHVGTGSDHHHSGHPILTSATLKALATGEIQVAQTREEIGCCHPNCRLGSAVVVPLKLRENTIGTLKLYHTQENSVTPVNLELARGLARLFSTQLEIAELEYQARLKTQAELKALQAQVHPHFLFNALNTITSLIRTRPGEARELLIKLAKFLRHSLRDENTVIPLAEELSCVEAYLAIEKARQGEKLQVSYRVDSSALGCPVLPLILQPLVENAVKHGLYPKAEGGKVEIIVEDLPGEVMITVKDNGVGIAPAELAKIPLAGYGRGRGLGLFLVNERLKKFYGPEYGLKIRSTPGQGTEVSLSFPKREVEGNALYGYCG